jgi:hypothetical protein
LDRNRRHSLQSLATPFLSIPFLREAIDPSYGNTKFDEISNGSFLEDIPSNIQLSSTEKQWISSLQQIVHHEIPLNLSCEDFRAFFRAKQERTSSSPSGRHFGHYRTMLECICRKEESIPNLVLNIAYISLHTASPLR